MLRNDKILKQCSQHDKLGLLSSRAAHLFTRDGGIGKEGTDYIYNKVGEVATGVVSERIFGFTEQYDWQILYEPEAISKFAEQQKGSQYIVHAPVISDETIFIAEPSAIWVKQFNQKDSDEYLVEPIQCKCPREYSSFMRYAAVQTPLSLKELFPKDYWRVLDSMLICEAIAAYFFIYHPLFDEGQNHHTIFFDRLSLLGDINFLKQRKREAAAIYTAAMNKLINKT
jgi:hypothetical protein